MSNVAGFPRIGDRRELKFATEKYWAGKIGAEELVEVARRIRATNWRFMQDAGVDLIPSNDFSLYDQVLDTTALVGAVPERYGHQGGVVDLDTYFAMARGHQAGGLDVPAMEMIKWFDTNYHYIVPELAPDTRFALSSGKPFEEFGEALSLGIRTVPVLIGPVTYLLLSKPTLGVEPDFEPLELLDRLLPVYEEVLARLASLGAEWVQIDEPSFAEDRSAKDLQALGRAYERLAASSERPKIVVKTYFDHAGEAYPVLAGLPVEGIGLDFVAGSRNEQLIQEQGGIEGKTLFAGVVDGRNVWINDLEASLDRLERLAGKAGKIVVSTSCSLLHLPLDLDLEPDLDDEIRSWIAFARQKVGETVVLSQATRAGRESVAEEVQANRAALQRRSTSVRTRNPGVRNRVGSLTERDARRNSEYPERRVLQRARLDLSLFPTTTIGSFPQTPAIRKARARLVKGELSSEEYQQAMRGEIEHVIRFQEDAGVDVLVHGEPERNDMVQYFAEQMEGFVFTRNAWVQSYGSRYVRPPILFGDVSRPHPMTIEWITYAQSLSERPVKGMLTGPVTMLKWSFVRDDQPTSETCKQLALAIRDEVADLERAGLKVIQVDEPALREGVPLRKDGWGEYLDWAVQCFRIATSGVADQTQVHTHLCYSELGDIIEAVAELDADVNLMWCARAGMRLLDDLQSVNYRNEVGPGVYDIHSPRIPSVDEMAEEIRMAIKRLDPEQIWVNPDCGLKTRTWDEAGPSVRNMVEAAGKVRGELTGEAS